MGEEVETFNSLGECFEAAVELLEENGINFRVCELYVSSGVGDSFKIKNKEIYGIKNCEGNKPWKLRVDYDNEKLFHINVDIGKGTQRPRAAYCKKPNPEASCEHTYRTFVTLFCKLNSASKICDYIQKEIDGQ